MNIYLFWNRKQMNKFILLFAASLSMQANADATGTVGFLNSTAAAKDIYSATCPRSDHRVMTISVLATSPLVAPSKIYTQFKPILSTQYQSYDAKSGDSIYSPVTANAYNYPYKSFIYVAKDACTTANASYCTGVKPYALVANCHTVTQTASTTVINPPSGKATLTLTQNQ